MQGVHFCGVVVLRPFSCASLVSSRVYRLSFEGSQVAGREAILAKLTVIIFLGHMPRDLPGQSAWVLGRGGGAGEQQDSPAAALFASGGAC